MLGFLLLVAAGVAAAYWFIGPTVWIDGGKLHFFEGEAGLRRVVWTTPTSVGDLINTDQQEYEPCVSPDGTELYFVRGRTGGGAHIYRSERRENVWTTATPVTAVNGPTDDLGPRLSPDGRYLFFYSDRPGGFGGYDIWASRRNSDGSWGNPFNLGSSINSEFNEYSPDPTPDGRHLIFATNRTAALSEQSESWHATIRQTNTTDYDLWIAELTSIDEPATRPTTGPAGASQSAGDNSISPLLFKNTQEIAGVNSKFAEGGSCMSPAGDFLYFSSNRPGGYGKFDLYRCPVKDWTFGKVTNLGPTINTADNEMDPMAVLGGYRLFFDSDRPGSRGGYDIFQSESREMSAARLSHPLPHVGWSGLAMIASLVAMVPLLMLLKSHRDRLTLLQICIVLSILFHVVLSFGLSFVVVSQNVRAYVKHETGVDLALSLPKSIELALTVRNPRSSEGPQAAAPTELETTPAAVELPRDKPLVSTNAPAADAGSRSTAIAPSPVAVPKVENHADAVAAAQTPLAPPTSLESVKVTPPHPIYAADPAAPSSVPPAPVSPLVRETVISPPAIIANDSSPPLPTARLSVGPEPSIASAPITLAAAAPEDPWGSVGDDPRAPVTIAAGPRVSSPSKIVPTGQAPATRPSQIAQSNPERRMTGDEPATGDQELASRAETPDRLSATALSGSSGAGVDPPAAPTATQHEAVATAIPPAAPIPSTVTAPPIDLTHPEAALDKPLVTSAPHLIPPPTPFHRAPEERKPLLARLGGTLESEAAVHRALGFLARVQEPDGHWTLLQEEEAPGKHRAGPHDMAYTGLALLAFLAQDHTPDSRDNFSQSVRRGLNFLVENQSPNGDLRGPPEFRGGASSQANLYDHAIATLAISEAALLTHDSRLAAASRAAANFIVRAQDSESGGWRYAPYQSGDSSVFGWQIMAMHSAEMVGGFKIPGQTRERALRYIQNVSAGRQQTLSGYQPGGSATQTMTAEMLFARMLLGERFDDAGIGEAMNFLAQYPPDEQEPDLYYWYYASLCMVQMRTPLWNDWNARTREALIHLQKRGGFGDGAWEVRSKRVDRAGYVFTTAIATLTLEVYYRYAPVLADSAP